MPCLHVNTDYLVHFYCKVLPFLSSVAKHTPASLLALPPAKIRRPYRRPTVLSWSYIALMSRAARLLNAIGSTGNFPKAEVELTGAQIKRKHLDFASYFSFQYFIRILWQPVESEKAFFHWSWIYSRIWLWITETIPCCHGCHCLEAWTWGHMIWRQYNWV